jgi:hypothetical protein
MFYLHCVFQLQMGLNFILNRMFVSCTWRSTCEKTTAQRVISKVASSTASSIIWNFRWSTYSSCVKTVYALEHCPYNTSAKTHKAAKLQLFYNMCTRKWFSTQPKNILSGWSSQMYLRNQTESQYLYIMSSIFWETSHISKLRWCIVIVQQKN